MASSARSIGLGLVWFPLPTPTSRRLAVGRDGHGRRIPAGGDEALDLAPFGRRDVDDGDAVVVGVGDVERLAVGGDRQGVGRAPFGGPGKRAVWIVSVTIPRRVSITETQLLDAQATKIRSSFGVDGDLVGMLADGDPGDGPKVGRVEDQHGTAGPVGDEELIAATCQHHVIGLFPHRCRFQFLAVSDGEDRNPAGIDVE